MTNVSSIGMQLSLSGILSNEMSNLTTLNEQLASGTEYTHLTDYDPTQAKSLVDFQSAITQRTSYLNNIQNVQNRLSLYDSTMTDMESLASQASSLAAQNQSYNASTASQIQSTAQNYLQQVADDLNQQIGGRYIYAGTRYSTQPVSENPTVLQSSPQPIITDGSTLPSYDAQVPAVATSQVAYGAMLPATAAVGTTAASSVTVYDSSGASHAVDYTWTKTGSHTWDLSVASPDSTQTVTVPFTFDSSTGALDSIGSGSGYTVETPAALGDPASLDMTLNFGGSTTPTDVTFNFGSYGLSTGSNALTNSSGVSTVTQNTFTQNGKAVTASNANAYTADSALIDSGDSLTYGVSSDNPAFQQLVNGLRYMNSAAAAGKSGDTVTYQTDMQQATTMINAGLAAIQGLHAGVANSQDLLTNQTTNQNNLITALQNQVGDIQNVDTTQVATEIQVLQTQLEASYSATGTLEKLSLVNYL